jgi:hypothetical protein
MNELALFLFSSKKTTANFGGAGNSLLCLWSSNRRVLRHLLSRRSLFLSVDISVLCKIMNELGNVLFACRHEITIDGEAPVAKTTNGHLHPSPFLS